MCVLDTSATLIRCNGWQLICAFNANDAGHRLPKNFLIEPSLFVQLLCPDHREAGNKRCFCPSVCLSVCPSVAYIATNSRTKKPSVPKFRMKVPQLRCDCRTPVSRSNGQMVKGQGYRRAGHTVSAEPGGHTACLLRLV